MITGVLDLRESVVDRYDRIKERFVWLMLDGYYVLDGDTVLVLRDRGESIFDVRSCRVFGVDTPETHTTDELEKEAGQWVRAAAECWCSHIPQGYLRIKDHGDDKYSGRFLGDLFDERTPHKTLSRFLREHGLAKHYVGGTKEAWIPRELQEVIESARSVAERYPLQTRDHSFWMPAIRAFIERQQK